MLAWTWSTALCSTPDVCQQAHLGDVKAPSQDIRGNEDLGGARPKLLHNTVAVILLHIALDGCALVTLALELQAGWVPSEKEATGRRLADTGGSHIVAIQRQLATCTRGLHVGAGGALCRVCAQR